MVVRVEDRWISKRKTAKENTNAKAPMVSETAEWQSGMT